MTARIISTREIAAARRKRRLVRLARRGHRNADQLPPLSSTLVDTLFDAEWDHRVEKTPRRRAA